MLLSDNGADVVKIEPPGGDPFRSSSGYAAWLRGRRSAVLDLTDGADRSTFLALARSADVVLESFSPGTTEKLGIDADTLMAENPRLVYCSITGYGSHPGHRNRPAYDALVAARLGLLHEQRGHLGGAIGHMYGEEPYLEDLPIPEGMEPGSPRSGPIFTYTPWPSMCAAYLATVGINAALLARLHTGRGQHVETSLLQAALSMTASKWSARRAQRRARLPHLDLRPQGSQGDLQVRRRPLDSAVGPQPALHPLQCGRGHPRTPARHRQRPQRPRSGGDGAGEHRRPGALPPGVGRGSGPLRQRRLGSGGT